MAPERSVFWRGADGTEETEVSEGKATESRAPSVDHPHPSQTHRTSALVPSLPKLGLVIACHGRQTETALYRHAHPCCNILNAAAEFGCQRTRSRTNCQCQCHCLRVQRILPTSKALGVCGNVEPVASWAKIPADRSRRRRLGLPFGQRLERQDACAGPR
jgi:hypothetical protein